MNLKLTSANFIILMALGCGTDRVLGHAPDSSGGQGNAGGGGALGGNSPNVGGTATAGTSTGGTSNQGVSTGGGGGVILPTGGAKSTGGAASGGAGTGGTTSTPGPCTGSFDAVSKTWATCPATYCEALQTDCHSTTSFLDGITSTSCGSLPHPYFRVTLEFGGTHSLSCFYQQNDLVGAMATDDVPSFCNQSSRTIQGGTVPSCPDQPSSTICDRFAEPEDAGSDAGPTIPPANCYNYMMNSCGPCCPHTDCSDKPDGYPGYSCVPKPPASFPSMADVHSMLDNPWCIIYQCKSGQPEGGC